MAGRPLEGISVLLIEDDRDTREFLSVGLRWNGARVVEADSGEAGLRLFNAERPRLIVADLAMPEMDGFEFVRALRALPPLEGGRTPAIAVTAHNTVEDRMATLRAGFTIHMAKPIDPHGLARVLASLLSS
jgi:CheY-like chemotaxis protein